MNLKLFPEDCGMRRHITRVSGFTLIELMVVIGIVGILAAIGLPNLSETLRLNRIRSSASAVQADVAYARNEAARRRADVSLCPIDSLPTGSDPKYTCSTDGGTWDTGWIIYVGTQDGAHQVVADSVLRVRNGLGSANKISVGSADPIATSDVLTLNPLGGARQTGVFNVCTSGATGKPGISVSVILSGQVTTGVSSCA